jgi:hypothetical protein
LQKAISSEIAFSVIGTRFLSEGRVAPPRADLPHRTSIKQK